MLKQVAKIRKRNELCLFFIIIFLAGLDIVEYKTKKGGNFSLSPLHLIN